MSYNTDGVKIFLLIFLINNSTVTHRAVFEGRILLHAAKTDGKKHSVQILVRRDAHLYKLIGMSQGGFSVKAFEKHAAYGMCRGDLLKQ